jgi:hypothetical protein
MPTMEAGDILGHEPMGEVVEVGRDVRKLKKGDRVVVPFTISCGACWFCQKRLFSLCDTSNPNTEIARKAMGQATAGLFGYSHMMGGYAGGQAEYVFTKYLRGPRTFVEFPGIGHRFDLPKISNDSPFLSGAVRFPPREILPGPQRLIGRTNGLTLVKQIELIPPDELRPNIEVIKSTTELGNLVTVLILNKGPGVLPAGLKKWTVRSSLFTGTVRLDPGQIPVGGTAVATGIITEIKIYQQAAVILPEHLKPQIDIISVNFARSAVEPRSYVENYVSVTFTNNNGNGGPPPPAEPSVDRDNSRR